MKIAVVTDDQKTISAHFRGSQYFLVFTVENGKIIDQEVRPIINRRYYKKQRLVHAETEDTLPKLAARYTSTWAAIIDCDVLFAGGMGQKAYADLRLRSIQPILTDIQDIKAAVSAYLSGDIINRLERLR
jgi:predicted Fe-Mo cluster-binding NifX family protein